MRRRRPLGRKIYTISYLLDKQPKALRKHGKWPLMISYLNSSRDILKIRFNKRCYSLLHNSVIKPENLDNFYKTYRLPKSPFFPLFFLIKREYLDERERKKKEREDYIHQGLSELPEYVKGLFAMMALLEKEISRANRNPIYRKHFLPKTKKRINDYLRFSHGDWIRFFDEYLGLLGSNYEKLPLRKIEYLDAVLALQCKPHPEFTLPDPKLVISQYRKLSKDCHPDRGGDSSIFIKVKWAKERLTNESL